jgi:hypothetical protein
LLNPALIKINECKLHSKRSKNSKVAGYRMNLQKSLAFPYIDNKQTEKEYMETIPFQ